MKKSRGSAESVPREGQLWAIPLPKLGFVPMVVSRVPGKDADVDFTFAYVHPSISTDPPESMPPLRKWASAWIGMVPTLPFRNRRWTYCADMPGFDREEWPVPPGRVSMVNESEPVEEWPKTPWGEKWSIETTPDEPTMLVIDNQAATRETALRFPHTDIVTSASSLEQGMVQYFKKREAGAWEMAFKTQTISPESIDLWNTHAAAARSRWAGIPSGWFPAGTRTDRGLKGGMWMGHPIKGGGFGASMLIEKPDRHLRLFSDAVIMGMRRRWDRWPTLENVVGLTAEDGAYVCQASMICVRDGRWRVLGEHPNFDPVEWVWPRPFWQNASQQRAGTISVSLSRNESVELSPDPTILSLDPFAGHRCRGSGGYQTIEAEIPGVMDKMTPLLKDTEHSHWGVVTPPRLKAWRAINAEISRLLKGRKSGNAK